MDLRRLLCGWVFLLAVPALAQEARPVLLLASTIGPIESGIVDFLEDRFEQDTGIRVRHVGAGTAAALDLARQGSVDLVLVHARSLEEKFIAEGYGTERLPLMYNDFVIVGPASDPARIRGLKTATEALRAIQATGTPFLSRGDQSGTHVAELALWAKAGIRPAGSWYRVFEQGSEGNSATLLQADQGGAYTVIDRASYLGLRGRIRLDVLVGGDEALVNHIALIPVNPAKCPRVRHREARAFAAWLVHPDQGQRLIATFGREKFGQALFTPEGRASNPETR